MVSVFGGFTFFAWVVDIGGILRMNSKVEGVYNPHWEGIVIVMLSHIYKKRLIWAAHECTPKPPQVSDTSWTDSELHFHKFCERAFVFQEKSLLYWRLMTWDLRETSTWIEDDSSRSGLFYLISVATNWALIKLFTTFRCYGRIRLFFCFKIDLIYGNNTNPTWIEFDFVQQILITLEGM